MKNFTLSAREVFWDDFLLQEQSGITVKMHRPEYRGAALRCDRPWEGNVCGYSQIVKADGKYRLYYRGADLRLEPDGTEHSHPSVICCAESEDGKTFTRPELGIYEYHGSRRNNIVFMNEDGSDLDNFSILYDTNPACPAAEKFKGLMGVSGPEGCSLVCFYSADGLHFKRERMLITDGAFDSFNLAFWDETRQRYFLYFRDLHDYPEGRKWDGIRDIRVCTSEDFHVWSDPQRICFGEHAPDYQLYTNGIKPYFRAPQVFLGTPTRYADRAADAVNFQFLPDGQHRSQLIKKWGRSGTAMTDCVLITSRDGFHFRRCDEAFLTPGIERAHNWYYGDCYLSWGNAETTADRDGAPNEISFYAGDHYRVDPVEFQRFSVRLDGFFSFHADFSGGSFLTVPVLLPKGEMCINFSTSALGSVRLLLCDENGIPIEGYDSGNLFGDSVIRPVTFARPLSELAQRPVRLKGMLQDAELYSMEFEPSER